MEVEKAAKEQAGGLAYVNPLSFTTKKIKIVYEKPTIKELKRLPQSAKVDRVLENYRFDQALLSEEAQD